MSNKDVPVVPSPAAAYRPAIDKMIAGYATEVGTDTSGALRDLLTDLIHFCDEHGFDASERFEAASAVADEHDEEKEAGG